ncbi:MAG: MltA domain-containing protein, partial [Bdellovibrionales bacterium]|nr:MltA domain-containing protein [Bdellovibrionales bacterium]
MEKRLIAFTLVLFFAACSRAPLKNNEDLMRITSNPPAIFDSLSKESFLTALKKHIEVMKISTQVQDPMNFGKKIIKKAEYIKSLEDILQHQEDYLNWIALNFDFYEVYGRDDWGEVMVTGYYEPKVLGSKIQTLEYSQALYSTPIDLLTINLKKFSSKFPKGEKLGLLQGRLVNQDIVPYYDRKEIDGEGKLKDQKNLILAWVDPVDSFFIQIQGSGTIIFENGEQMRVGYDA